MAARFFRTITRPKFVISLFALILSASVLGAIVPQTSYLKPAYFAAWQARSPKIYHLVDLLRLDRIYSSAWFLALVALVLLSLGYSIYEQTKRNLHAMRHFPRQGDASGKDGAWGAAAEEERAIRFMEKRRYAFRTRDDGGLLFSKNSINRWGGVIFHSGLFLIIVAAIVSLAFQKRGFAQVMEGGIFSGRDADFLTKHLGVFAKRFDTGFKIRLNKFQYSYWDTGDAKSFESFVSVIQGDSISEHTIAEDNPLVLNGVRVFQSSHYGYALSFLITKPTGEDVVTHFLLDRPDRLGMPAVGKNDFATTDYFFDMTFYPDITRPSFFPTMPIVFLKVTEAGKPVFQGLMIPGEAVKVKKDVLQFEGISNWTGLSFTEHNGTDLAYAGFLVALIGLIIIYLMPYKEIRVRLDGRVPAISGWTKKYPALFEEELSEITAALGEIFTAETTSRGESVTALELQESKT